MKTFPGKYHQKKFFKLISNTLKVGLLVISTSFVLNTLHSASAFACSANGNNTLDTSCVSDNLPSDIQTEIFNYDRNSGNSGCYNSTPKYYTAELPWISQQNVPENDSDIQVPANDQSYALQLNGLVYLCNQQVS